MLKISELSCGYNGHAVLENANFEVVPGDIVCVLGANGMGKTTLYRTIMNILPPVSGNVLIDGVDISTMKRKQLAKKIAYVPQAAEATFPYSVLDVVTMGRTAHLSFYQSPSGKEENMARLAMKTLGISSMAKRCFSEISGGERQLVLIARALAQDAEILLMDEPTSSLDFGNQAQILQCIRMLATKNRSIIYSTHSPDHAFSCSTKVLALVDKDKFALGPAQEVLTEEVLKNIYGIDVDIFNIPTQNGVSSICVPART